MIGSDERDRQHYCEKCQKYFGNENWAARKPLFDGPFERTCSECVYQETGFDIRAKV